MTSDSERLADLIEDAEKLASRLNVVNRVDDLGRLLTFDLNLSRPIHRWYKFKEGFSDELVQRLIEDYPLSPRRTARFLDPFCGVGTSLLAADVALHGQGIREVTLCGIEVNPYMRFVSSTKLGWAHYDPVFFLRAAAASTNGVRLRRKPEIPDLSTMRDERFIRYSELQRILELRDKLKTVAKGRRELRPLLLGLVAGAERVFRLRKDGRALRYTPREGIASVDGEVDASWSEIAEDLQLGLARPSSSRAVVVKGDGRRADRVYGGRFDVILFSPPYLNNIDYTEVYKIEQWLLGFLSSGAQMVAQRRRTFRSHPSCVFPEYRDASAGHVVSLLGAPFQRLISYASGSGRWRGKLFADYFADMFRTLQSCRRLVKPDGRLFLVIGNSVHGTADRPIPVATDLWTASLAEAAGLRVDAVLVGRRLPRRRMDWSGFRESIIVMSRK